MNEEEFWHICNNQNKWRLAYHQQQKNNHQNKLEEMRKYDSRKPKPDHLLKRKRPTKSVGQMDR